MRVLGIDPGIAIVGFAILEYTGARQFMPLEYGSIETEAGLSVATRLNMIHRACQKLIAEYKPEDLAIEQLFWSRNTTTAFTVSQARGVVLLAAAQAGLEVTEYTPLQVKMAVTGYGKADKKQVQEMVKLILKLPSVPKPDDVADALAIAICDVHTMKNHIKA